MRRFHDTGNNALDVKTSPQSREIALSFHTPVENSDEDPECFNRRTNATSPHTLSTPNQIKRKLSTGLSGQEKRSRLSSNQQCSDRHRNREPSFSSEDELDNDRWDGNSDEEDIDPVENWEPRMKYRMPSPRKGRIANPNNAVLKHRSTTKLTPWLYRLAKPFYNDKIQEISCRFLDYSKNATLVTSQEMSRLLRHVQNEALKDTSKTPEFCSLPIWTAKHGKRGYPSAEVHGITYYPGDYILLSGKGKS